MAPAGGWAQIKIYAVKPTAISSGHLVLTLDSTAFGTGAMVGLFGANADASGLATTTGSQIDVQFSSPTGGIGQLAGLPVMVVSVPVLATATGTVTVSATSPDSSVTVASGSVTVQGTLSVGKIPAGMGVVPVGTVVPVTGTGFTASTTVTMDGVVIASTQFVSSTEIDMTTGGATELVGKLARVTDNGVEFDYFCFQPNDPVNFPESTAYGSRVNNVQPSFAMFEATGFSGYNGYSGGVIEVQNPNSATAMVNLGNVEQGPPSVQETQTAVAIPAGSWAIFDGQADTSFSLASNLPVRAVAMNFCPPNPAATEPVCLATPSPADPASYAAPTAPVVTPSSLAFAWQMGSSTLPAARTVTISSSAGLDVVFSANVTAGGAWLSVPQAAFGYVTTVSVNPSGLALGTYQGSITVSPSYGPSTTLPVTLTVTDTYVPMLSVTPASIGFTAPTFNSTPYSQTIAITSDSGPTPFTVSTLLGLGADTVVEWIKVSPSSGTTPAILTVTWDPAATSQIYYLQLITNGSIVINGLGNTITIPATFTVSGVQTYQTFLGVSGMGPGGLTFSAQTGTGAQMQAINVVPLGTLTATVSQPWMSAAPVTTGLGVNQAVDLTVNPAGLAAGVYQGALTIGEPGLVPCVVPVTLGVWSTPPQLTVSQSSFTFVQQVGELSPPFQTAQVGSGGIPVAFNLLQGASWLTLDDPYNGLTPTTIQVGTVNASTMPPGQYNGSFTVQSPGSSVYVPVTLLVEPGPTTPPVIASVVNAASGIPGAVSPGEIVSVRGYGVGASLIGNSINTNLNGLQITFDGTPATLFYTSANQTNLVVPTAVNKSTVMQVSYQGQTAAWVLPVVGSQPGIFTIDGTGTGQGAIVNQDGTVNSASNPAARGSVISIYMTGQPQVMPLATGILPTDATVMIGGIAATVQFSGQAPGEISGLTQVNAFVPQGVAPGSAVPVIVSFDGVPSQAGVTAVVK